MTAGMVTAAWMHQPVSAEQYQTWTEDQRAGIEIVNLIEDSRSASNIVEFHQAALEASPPVSMPKSRTRGLKA